MNESAALSSSYGLSYSEWAVGEAHHALVVAPEQDIQWGREMLARFRRRIVNSARDVEIVQTFERAPSRPRVFVFRGTNGDGSVRIHLGDLDPDEREELGYSLFLSHLPVLRRLTAGGAQLFVYVDWEPDTLELFRRSMGRIAGERKAQMDARADPDAVPILRLDQWIFTRLTLFCAQSLGDVLTQLLPDSLPLFDRREERVARLLEGVSADCFRLDTGEPPP